MAVQKAFEILEGRVHSGDRESGVSYTRVFSVWTTTPDTTTSGAVVRPCGLAFDTNSMAIEIQNATVI